MGLHLSKVPKLFDLTRYETKTKETTKLAGVSKKGFPFLEASLNQYSVKIIIFAGGVCLEKRGYSSWEIFFGYVHATTQIASLIARVTISSIPEILIC